jgi:hypothetical protein
MATEPATESEAMTITVTTECDHARTIIADRFFDSRYPHYAGRRRDFPRLSEWAEREAEEIIDALQAETDDQPEDPV